MTAVVNKEGQGGLPPALKRKALQAGQLKNSGTADCKLPAFAQVLQQQAVATPARPGFPAPGSSASLGTCTVNSFQA